MRGVSFFIISCFLAAFVPFLPVTSGPETTPPFPGWPARFVSQGVRQLPLSKREKEFEKGFPGRIGHFCNKNQEIVIRWVTSATRKLHPAADCYRGLGYSVQPAPLFTDSENIRWGCFFATKGNKRILVKERIYDSAGKSWTDVSAWYWSAVLGKSTDPWWAITVAEKPF